MKKSLFPLAGLAGLGLLAVAAAAPLERDLGEGLTYCRVHALPADLPATPARPAALVLDLRYARSDDGAATALDAWLKFRRRGATPVLVLVNAETAPAVLACFATGPSTAGVITLGPASPSYTPDIAVKFPPAGERAAYDALEHDTPVAALLTDNPGKARHDEASLAEEKNTPPDDPAEADPTGDAKETTPGAGAAPPPPPLIDHALQRAVHLHRALLALKRI